MRPYRGRRLDNGEWVYGGLIKPLNSPRRYIGYIELMDEGGEVVIVHYDEVDPATVGQSTGLKDKNGKEMYADDRVKFTTISGGIGIGVVEYGEYLYFCRMKTGAIYEFAEFESVEVIGNIHNKEVQQ